jgi:hypothetical protein
MVLSIAEDDPSSLMVSQLGLSVVTSEFQNKPTEDCNDEYLF